MLEEDSHEMDVAHDGERGYPAIMMPIIPIDGCWMAMPIRCLPLSGIYSGARDLMERKKGTRNTVLDYLTLKAF